MIAHQPRTEHRQRLYRVRLEWGVEGIELLAAECAAVVVVDVLSFCTTADIAVGRGAAVLPQRSADPAAAAARGAVQAGDRHGDGPSLRPSSLAGLASGTRLALPSPNGATLCTAARGTELFAGCLRNASAVAAALRGVDGPAGLVPAGERWPDGTMRVAMEDALGAGAIAAALTDRSPEADAAADLFAAARARGLAAVLGGLASGRELIADGFAADIDLAAAHDVSPVAPRMRSDGFLAAP
ncbi:MAG: 2-phosphosulfolactate phosphatase [Pseudonocardia sp.]|nr:2-phosphosulfolactate phosphatase [Pseudonocardia sp.]